MELSQTGQLTPLNRLVFASPRRVAMPIATYPGLLLTHATVRDIVTSPQAQFDAQAALHARYHNPVVLSAMDLSAEAEAFGSAIHLSENEIPSVIGRLITSFEQARALPVPKPGDKRTAVPLEAVRLLRKISSNPLVLGGCIGPFSLAARLVGVSEAMELTVTEPELMETLLEKAARFLTGFGQAFKSAGADGLLMAEPAAGLLSPRALSRFSSRWIHHIVTALDDETFCVILHNCAAKAVHLSAILESRATALHFGAPMDLPAALATIPSETVICGNLDPAGLFCQASVSEVKTRTTQLLAATSAHRNFVISSGCDVPPNASLASLDAFYQAVA